MISYPQNQMIDGRWRMPAEWEHHSGTQLHWPSNRETWPGKRMDAVENVYCRFIEELHFYDKVHLFCTEKSVKDRAVQKLSKRAVELDRIVFHIRPVNDVWARDCGPIFIEENKQFRILNWEYNAWGEKYPPWEDDNSIPEYVGNKYGIDVISPGMVLEGGSIDVNGSGLCMTTRSVLLNPNRNPGLTEDQIEQNLKKYLGLDEVIWLNRGLAGDDTDGHIDDIARFTDQYTVMISSCDDPDDINYEALNENRKILENYRTADGEKLRVVTVPLPYTRTDEPTVDGSDFIPASYANFYIANGGIFVPVYGCDTDAKALEIIGSLFPKRKVIGIPAKELVWGQGSLHCITQQWYSI